MATIDSYYFRVCTRGAERQGWDAHRLLKEVGVDPLSLAMPGWRGDVTVMARLVRHIWDQLEDEFMGFTRHAMPRGAFAFATSLALEGVTIADGLRRAMRFYNLACRDVATEAVETESELIVSTVFAEPTLDPDHYFSEFWQIIWHRLASWLAGETIPLLGADFDYDRPKEYFEEFKYLFPCPHHFGTSDRRIRLDIRSLHGPVLRTSADLDMMLNAAPLDLMTIPASDSSLQRQVRLCLAHDPAIPAQTIATSFGMSTDTLRRRLRDEGYSLSSIRENLRRDAAMRALQRTHQSVESIAEDLGYAESRSFTRAFRAWTGTSPSEYRDRRYGR